MGAVEVIAPNFKRRLSGVTSTIVQLVPLQARRLGIATLGPGLPDALPKMRARDLAGLWRRPRGRPFRVWHARRNVEMLAGLVLRDLLRAPLRLVFTSASQRRHTAWTRFLIGRMDAVVATSARTGAYLSVPHRVVLHGIDAARFSPPADRAEACLAVGLDPALSWVGCFGRVRRQKGTDLFVDAVIALLPSRPRWGAVIAGRATADHRSFEDELKKRVEQAGLAGRIRFVGEHADIPPWYRALSLFVAPQRWEGFGLTPLEAMASGVPVVATDVGAFSELVVEGETGTIVPPDDLAAMTSAATRFMDDDGLRDRAGSAAISHVRRNFPLEREAGELAEIYEALWAGAR
ncbi:MAG: glycosyltransferase family 4 protein [Rhizobiaceae bacterium]|nr:glycosyltransferase family 4 protein [Rhizobiaceae bacterium]MCV0408601.1 glycosyltransferase family 4 protein [Rhizobiaceae bacterium]